MAAPAPFAAPSPAVHDAWAGWDRLVESTAGGFMQTSWWAQFRAGAGYRHFAALVRADGQAIGGAVVQSLRCDCGVRFLYVPDGPVLPPDDALAAESFRMVLRAADEERRGSADPVSHLRIEPRWTTLPAFVTGFRPLPAFHDAYMEPRDTLIVDLAATDEELLAQMKPKGRYNIRIARRHGVRVVADADGADLDAFMAIYADMAHRQRLAPKPRAYFDELLDSLASCGRGGLYFAEHAGERLAAALVVRFGATATYFFGASLDRRRELMAPYLLHFEAMRHERALGCRQYDFWGIAPPGAAGHPWSGITDFKRKFGGRTVSWVPTLDLVYDEAAYRRFAEAEGDADAAAPPPGPCQDRRHAAFSGGHP